MKTLYTAVATASEGGRDGHTRTDDGKVDFELSTPKEMGGEGGEGTNPEQLFAAGYAACFANAMRSSARREGSLDDVDGATVTAHVSIGALGKGRFGLGVFGSGAAHLRQPFLRSCASRSLKLGRSGPGVDLRPNSIATCGGWPRRKPMMQVLMVV